MALPNPPVLTNVLGKTEALEVSWEQVIGSVLNYVIYYGTAPGVYAGSLVVPVTSLLDPNAPQYDIIGLVNNSTYWVTVAAVETGTEIETVKSAELAAVTTSSQMVIQPSDLIVAAGDSSIVLSWNSTVMDGFRIEYTRDINEPRQWNGIGAIQGNSPIEIEGNVSEYTMTGLENNTGNEAPYYFRVSARRGDTHSPPTEEVVGVPQGAFTTALSGNYAKISLQPGLNLVAVPVSPKSFTPDTYNLGKFMGGAQILWKAPGSSNFTARLLALPTGETKVIDPMEAVFIIMPTPGTKYLIGDSWKNV